MTDERTIDMRWVCKPLAWTGVSNAQPVCVDERSVKWSRTVVGRRRGVIQCVQPVLRRQNIRMGTSFDL